MYLADRLPFYEYENCEEYVKDYGQLEDYLAMAVSEYIEVKRISVFH